MEQKKQEEARSREEAEKNKYEGMVLIPAGEFLMGSSAAADGESDEKPAHKVYLDTYYIDKYEVTFEQYDKFCEATGRSKPGDNGWGRGNRPVIIVSWDSAAAYAEWAGKRLPTEAEWEKAARAGSNTKYCFGDGEAVPRQRGGEAELGDYAWYKGNSGNKTHPVGTKKPNKWGIYDMYGNVWEWCSDWFDENYYKNSPYKNPDGPDNGSNRVLRGGSWCYDANGCRSANRYGYKPDDRCDGFGFRCVAAPEKVVVSPCQNKMYKKKKEELSGADFKKILSHCADWLKPVVEFAYKTGLRLGEIANLQWNNVDSQNARVVIDEKMSKNGKSRVIQIDSSTFGLLEPLYKKRESDYVFSGNKTQKLSTDQVLRAFRSAINKAGLRGIIFHSLRMVALKKKTCSE